MFLHFSYHLFCITIQQTPQEDLKLSVFTNATQHLTIYLYYEIMISKRHLTDEPLNYTRHVIFSDPNQLECNNLHSRENMFIVCSQRQYSETRLKKACLFHFYFLLKNNLSIFIQNM